MITTFWKWFWSGAAPSKAGWRLLINRWLLLHISVAAFLYHFVDVDPYQFAGKALFPAASILVGMAVAWTSRASTILQDKEFREKIVNEDRPLEDYVYGYQLSLLVIMSLVVFVTLVANGGLKFEFIPNKIATDITGVSLYFLLSMAIRECWSVVNFSNL